MDEVRRFDRIAFLGGVTRYLPKPLKAVAATLETVLRDETGLSLVVARATEILGNGPWNLPPWVDTETQYLVVLDVPEQTIPRLATILRLHKPDRRLHISRDPGVVRRSVIALSRSAPWEGLIDAYVVSDLLCVLLGDMVEREFPRRELPQLRNASRKVFENFSIDSAGSFLYWPDLDLHIGASQMLQAVDPTYLADVEIERYTMASVSQALQAMRVERDLRQTDIEGLSERHVRRLEKERARLTVDAAEKLARAFGQDLGGFLNELSERVVSLRGEGSPSDSKALVD